MRSFRYFFLTLLAIAIVFSCKKIENNPADNPVTAPANSNNPIPVTGISISTDSVLLNQGSAQRLTISFTPANATNRKVLWSSSNPAVATVDSTGLITALASGDVIVSGRSVDNAALTVTSVVIVLGRRDIYIAGEGADVGAPTSGAAYWVNGNATMVTDPGANSLSPGLSGIIVSGNDVYISGYTHNNGGFRIPTYWKNNNIVQFEMPGPLDDTIRVETGIAVTGNKVHLVGYNFFNTPQDPGVFQAFHYIDDGGVITSHRYPAGVDSRTFGISVSGNDVYIAGATSDGISTAQYWKNGWSLQTPLTDGNSYAVAQAITVKGTDILIAGRDGCATSSCISSVKLWKNNMTNPIVVSDGLYNAEATCIATSGNDIYIGGFQNDAAGTAIGKLWKVSGSTITAVTLSDGQHRTRITGLSVIGNDVFVCGYDMRPDNSSRGWYWRLYGSHLIETVQLSWYGYYVNPHTKANAIFIK